jgi:hypothetical protein
MPKKLPKPSPTAQKKEKKDLLIKVRVNKELFWEIRHHSNVLRIGMSEFARLAFKAEIAKGGK